MKKIKKNKKQTNITHILKLIFQAYEKSFYNLELEFRIIFIYIYVCMYLCNKMIESLQILQLVDHNILGEMKSQFFMLP